MSSTENKAPGLPSLKSIHEEELNHNDVIYNGCCFAERNAHAHKMSSEFLEKLKYPFRAGVNIILLCTGGRMKFSCNVTAHDMTPGMVLLIRPEDIVQFDLESDNDFSCMVIATSPSMLANIQLDYRNIISTALRSWHQNFIEITPEQCAEFQSLFHTICREIRDTADTPFYDEIVRSYLKCILYKILNWVSVYSDSHPKFKRTVKSRNEEYFINFIHLLSENFRKERSVGFYASQLCITPKYFTTLIKRISGKTAATWIDEYVILEAKNLLRYSSMSIQEVAYALNFPNQSFFGKYFKQQTGMSPSAYKMQK